MAQLTGGKPGAAGLARLGKPPVPTDAVDLLLECHQRIRTFLDLASRIAGPAAAGDPGLAEAAGRVHRYFAEALPLHARDEEESVLPRLRGREAALDAELAAMAREHAEHQGPLSALLAASRDLAGDPGRHPDLAPAIAAAADELRRHFAGHLRREEEVIFPAMRRLLDARADAEVSGEMRARRGAATAPPPGPEGRPGPAQERGSEAPSRSPTRTSS